MNDTKQMICKYLILLSTLLIFLLTGCAATVSEEFTGVSPFNDTKESIAFIKINHGREGTTKLFAIKNVMNSSQELDSSSSNSMGEDRAAVTGVEGYFALKIKAPLKKNEYISIGPVSIYGEHADNPRGYWGEEVIEIYCGMPRLAFQINQPGVYYLGDMTIRQDKAALNKRIDYNIDINVGELKKHLAKHYPNVSSNNIKMTQQVKSYPSAACKMGTIYIY